MRRALSCCSLLVCLSCVAENEPPAADGDGDGSTQADAEEDGSGQDATGNDEGTGNGDGSNDSDGPDAEGDGSTGDGDDAGSDDRGDTGEDGNDSGGDGADSGDGGDDDEPAVVRFVAFGDAGEGNDDQFMVAYAIEEICVERGCDFALYLGDNFYDDGVSSAMDEQFIDKFEMPYMDLDFPFFVALGNHDYGLLSNAWEKSQYQIDYSLSNDKWILPSHWYSWTASHVQFFALDTTQLMWNRNTAQQQQWFEQQVNQSDAEWKIAFGHHPYISNGSHGNAGNYEGIPLLDFISGRVVKLFMDESLVGVADVYLSGHDHTRQWMAGSSDTEFIVSGAGSKVEPLVHRDGNSTHYEDDTIPGFLWVEIDGNTFSGLFYDRDGNLSYERSFSK